MRFKEIVTERNFAGDIQIFSRTAKSEFAKLKPQLVGQNLDLYAIKSLLDSSPVFKALGIQFIRTMGKGSNEFSDVGLAGGQYSPEDDSIHVYFLSSLQQVVDDSYTYDEFAMKALETITHELTHRRQYQDRPPMHGSSDDLTGRAYMAHPDELMAFANQVATELLQVSGESPEQLIRSLKNTNSMTRALSTTLTHYLDEFEEGSPERKQFLKYLVMFIGKAVGENLTESASATTLTDEFIAHAKESGNWRRFRYSSRDNCGPACYDMQQWAKEKYNLSLKRIRGYFVGDNVVHDKADFTPEMKREFNQSGLNFNSPEDRKQWLESSKFAEQWKEIPHYWLTDNNGNIYDPTGKAQIIDTGLAADLDSDRYKAE